MWWPLHVSTWHSVMEHVLDVPLPSYLYTVCWLLFFSDALIFLANKNELDIDPLFFLSCNVLCLSASVSVVQWPVPEKINKLLALSWRRWVLHFNVTYFKQAVSDMRTHCLNILMKIITLIFLIFLLFKSYI